MVIKNHDDTNKLMYQTIPETLIEGLAKYSKRIMNKYKVDSYLYKTVVDLP